MPAIDRSYGRRTPRPPRTPSPTQIAKAQERYYASQGRAVERVARAQKTTGLVSPPATSGPKYRAAVRARQQRVAAQRRAVRLERRADRVKAGRQAEQFALRAERAYADLGRSVQSQAQLQGAVARGQRATARETIGGGITSFGRTHPATAARGKYADLNRQTFGAIGKTPAELAEIAARLNTRDPTKRRAAEDRLRTQVMQAKAAGLSPAGQKILDQISRGGYASAGAARALVRGENVAEAAQRGVRLQDRYLYGDVLREAGWRPKGGLGKAAQSVVGSTLDIALDPTTYLSGGVSSVARKGAVQAARATAAAEAKRVMARELQAGATRATARRIGRAEGAKAGASAYERHIARSSARERERIPHVSIGIGRARVGTPVRATAAARRGARGARRATARAVERVPGGARVVASARGARVGARQAASEFNALVRPPGMGAEQWARTRQIERTKRATGEQIARRGAQRAATLRALTRPAEQKAIRDAIEADDIARLKGQATPIVLSKRIRNRAARALARDPDRLYELAKIVRRDPQLLRERAVQAGVPVGYVGRKPPVQIPEVTADVNAAWRQVMQAKTPAAKRVAVSELRRVERAAVTQKTHRRLALKAAERREREAKGYVPRVRAERLQERGPLTLEDVLEAPARQQLGGAKRPRPSTGRKVTEPIAELERRAAAGDEIARRYIAEHTEDLPLALRAYSAGMGRGIAHAEANRALVAEGRPILKGKPLDLSEGERVYAYEGSDLRELKPSSHADAHELSAIGQGTAKGDYVALPKAMVEHVTGTEARTRGQAGAAWDRFWGHWKGFALGTPSYLVRNALGDAFAAYGAQNPAALARNYVKGQRALNEYGRSERAYKWFQSEMETGGKGTSTTVNGQPIRYRDLALEAEAAGVIKQGRLAEIRDQMSSAKAGKVKATEGGWRRTVQRVEDSARLATYIGARGRGLTPEAAAAQVAKIHFDYGELTRIERGLRKAMPFYTFSARNLPRMVELLATKPGKLAAAEKTRQEFQKTSGLPPDYLQGLDPYEQRQLGIPLRIGGKVYTVSAGLPFTDLSDLPVSAAGAKNLAFRPLGMLGPFPKAAVEELLNVSAFYRAPIQDPHAPRTPVPAPIAKLADAVPAVRKRLGIKRILDKRTGKLVWGWPKQVDYGVRQALPGLAGAAYRLSQTTTARDFSPLTEAVGLSGIRAKPYDPQQARLNVLYERQRTLQARRDELNQAGVNSYRPTADYRRVQTDLSAVNREIDQLNRGRLKFYKGRPTSRPQPTGGVVRRPAPAARRGGGVVRRPAPELVR